MKNSLVCASLLVVTVFISSSALAQSPSGEIATPTAASGPARFYVAPSNDGFANFLNAALLENRLPILVTADESTADYVVIGSNSKGQNKWYDTMFGVEKDRNQGSMKVIRVSDKVVVWASASGDKSFWFAEFKNMGQAKVANRLARKLKNDLPRILSMPAAKTVRNGQAAEIIHTEMASNNTSYFGSGAATTAEEHIKVGLEQFQKGNYTGAEVSFRQAVLREPGNASYHYNLGTALAALGSLDEAQKEIESAARLAPTEETYKKALDIIRNQRKIR